VDGIRTADRYMPDRLPLFGRAAEGLYWALGGSGAGFKVAPALARRLAQTIAKDLPRWACA
jgi:glycine/D-amino acid oxidase-like deaminating enzyme